MTSSWSLEDLQLPHTSWGAPQQKLYFWGGAASGSSLFGSKPHLSVPLSGPGLLKVLGAFLLLVERGRQIPASILFASGHPRSFPTQTPFPSGLNSQTEAVPPELKPGRTGPKARPRSVSHKVSGMGLACREVPAGKFFVGLDKSLQHTPCRQEAALCGLHI